jgi:hypothetical protein
MINTDNRQLSIDASTGNPRWIAWEWKEDESKQWTKFRQRAEKLFLTYSDKKFKNTTVRDSMLLLIKETRRYDIHKSEAHHLLAKVQIKGTIDDWQTFHIKQGTSLEKKAERRSGEVGTQKPLIVVRKTDVGMHLLSVTNLETPKSRALPEGIAAVRVYRHIGTEPAKKQGDYKYAGIARRGIFRSHLSGLVPDSDKKQYASYIASYVSTHGKEGEPCLPVRAVII